MWASVAVTRQSGRTQCAPGPEVGALSTYTPQLEAALMFLRVDCLSSQGAMLLLVAAASKCTLKATRSQCEKFSDRKPSSRDHGQELRSRMPVQDRHHFSVPRSQAWTRGSSAWKS